MPGYVYILFSASLQKTYTGSTDNVEKRLHEHNSGKSTFTSRGIPWKLWHVIPCITLEEARKMEKYFKTGAGRRKLRQILDSIPRP
jgi:putative endonuclease